MKKLTNKLCLLSILYISILRSACPDALYSCFADKKPNLFTVEEIAFYNKQIDGAIEKPEHRLFPFVSVGTYYKPLQAKCVKNPDAQTRAAYYCNLKYPHKKNDILVEEFTAPNEVIIYQCGIKMPATETISGKRAESFAAIKDGEDPIYVLAYDLDMAKLKCAIVANSIGHPPIGLSAIEVKPSLIKRLDLIGRKLEKNYIAVNFLAAWEDVITKKDPYNIVPQWIKDIILSKKSISELDVKISALKTLSQLLEQYEDLYTRDKSLPTAEQKNLLSSNLKSDIFSPTTAINDLKSSCRRLKLLYHPDKHAQEKTWWTEKFKQINDACDSF